MIPALLLTLALAHAGVSSPTAVPPDWMDDEHALCANQKFAPSADKCPASPKPGTVEFKNACLRNLAFRQRIETFKSIRCKDGDTVCADPVLAVVPSFETCRKDPRVRAEFDDLESAYAESEPLGREAESIVPARPK